MSGTPDWRNDSELAGNCVLLTGAAGGIGRAVTHAVAQAGATVVAVDCDEDPLAQLRAELPGNGHQIIAADLADLSTHDDIVNAAVAAAPTGGRFVALIHMAAVLRRRATVDDVTEDDWDTQSDVNLKATFFLNRTAWRAFRQRGEGGSIVNFTSQGWWTGGFGGSVAYSATKGGIVSLTRGLARSFAPDGVRVNAVAPGGISTQMFHGGLDEKGHEEFIAQIPTKRLGDPAELAGPALFLASGASRYMTGTVLNVSGGQLVY